MSPEPTTAIQKKSQSSVVLAAIVIAGIVGGYLYYSQVLQQLSPPQVPQISASDTLAKFKEIKFDFSIFNDAQFKALRTIGESPVQPGVTGKDDLFAPF
jgi:hypothetical protein